MWWDTFPLVIADLNSHSLTGISFSSLSKLIRQEKCSMLCSWETTKTKSPWLKMSETINVQIKTSFQKAGRKSMITRSSLRVFVTRVFMFVISDSTDGTVCSDVSCITAYRDSMYILSAIAFLTAFANYGRQTTGQPWDASLFHHPPEAAWIIEGRGKERETRKRSKNKRRRRALTVSEIMLMSFNCVRWVTAADEPSWR